MVALTVNWGRLAMYLGTAALLLLMAGVGVALFLVGSVAAYMALCMGMKVAATMIFAMALLPLAGLLCVAMAFWTEDRQQRIRAALGRRGL